MLKSDYSAAAASVVRVLWGAHVESVDELRAHQSGQPRNRVTSFLGESTYTAQGFPGPSLGKHETSLAPCPQTESADSVQFW